MKRFNVGDTVKLFDLSYLSELTEDGIQEVWRSRTPGVDTGVKATVVSVGMTIETTPFMGKRRWNNMAIMMNGKLLFTRAEFATLVPKICICPMCNGKGIVTYKRIY